MDVNILLKLSRRIVGKHKATLAIGGTSLRDQKIREDDENSVHEGVPHLDLSPTKATISTSSCATDDDVFATHECTFGHTWFNSQAILHPMSYLYE